MYKSFKLQPSLILLLHQVMFYLFIGNQFLSTLWFTMMLICNGVLIERAC